VNEFAAEREAVFDPGGGEDHGEQGAKVIFRGSGKKMLILTRRVGETLMIGDDIVVTVLGVKGNQVRLGVGAPKDVAVHREEIYRRIQKEQGNAEPAEE